MKVFDSFILISFSRAIILDSLFISFARERLLSSSKLNFEINIFLIVVLDRALFVSLILFVLLTFRTILLVKLSILNMFVETKSIFLEAT